MRMTTMWLGCALLAAGLAAANAADAPKENKGFGASKTTVVELGQDFPSMAGRQLRLRLVTIQPGGHRSARPQGTSRRRLLHPGNRHGHQRRRQFQDVQGRRHDRGERSRDSLAPQRRAGRGDLRRGGHLQAGAVGESCGARPWFETPRFARLLTMRSSRRPQLILSRAAARVPDRRKLFRPASARGLLALHGGAERARDS